MVEAKDSREGYGMAIQSTFLHSSIHLVSVKLDM